MNCSIRQATPGDLVNVSDILLEAAAWQAESGWPMWRTEDLGVEKIAGDLDAYFLAHIGDRPVGTVKFQLEDRYVWPDVGDDAAAYVHRLAVRRSFAGTGVSTAMLAWAADRARSLGKRFLRLDCDTTRPRLRKFYEDFGFIHHSDKQWGSILITRYVYPID